MKEDLTYDLLLQYMRDGTPFTWSRWGDGEWSCLLQNRPGSANCDGHHYFPDLGKALKDILESQPPYFLGLQRLATEQLMGNDEFQRLRGMNQWCNNELLHHASIKGRLGEFFEALKERQVSQEIILVANAHTVKKLLPLGEIGFKSVVIPEKDCWNKWLDIQYEIDEAIKSATHINVMPVILYCASMMSNVLIDKTYTYCKAVDIGITQIDCGSVFDPYCGRNTRSYHHKLNIK
jgi:hypothetical protein